MNQFLRRIFLVVAIVAVVSVSSGCISIITSRGDGAEPASRTAPAQVKPLGDSIDPRVWTDGEGIDRMRPQAITSQTYVRLADKASAAVVSIFTTQRVRTGIGDPLGLFRVPFKDFHAQSLGSGFVIHEDGFVVTNAHVVADADEIQVLMKDEKEPFVARLVGLDTLTDLAILKIETKRALPVLPLADSGDVRVGDVAVAIGNPYGLQHSLTVGVISAKGRRISRSSIKAGQEDYLQTSAQINPGNSGGPLLNLAGEVMGINTAIYAKAQGIGFAIPSDIIKELVPPLVRDGRIERSYLGLLFAAKEEGATRQEDGGGVLVYYVYAESPASSSGIRRGDVVLSINGEAVSDPFEASRMISEMPIGSRVRMRIKRPGGEFDASMTTVSL